MGGWQVQPGFGCIQSYEQAHALWMKGKGFSKRHTEKIKALVESDPNHTDEHALDGRKKHMTMCLQSPADVGNLYRKMGLDGADPGKSLRHYAFTYQRTDIVTYREDGAIFVQGYGSTSTNIMLGQLLPDSVKVHCKTGWRETSNLWSRDILMLCPHSHPGHWHDDDFGRKVYQLSTLDFMLIRGEYAYELVNPERVTRPWISISVNRALARETLASTRYREFVQWARMYIHMERECKPERLKYELDRNSGMGAPLIDAERAKFYLSSVDYWPGLVAIEAYHPKPPPSSAWGLRDRWEEARNADRGYLGRLHADRLARGLRLALYSGNTAVLDRASLPFVRNLRVAQACLASVERWED